MSAGEDATNLGSRTPGASTTFADSSSGEVVLQIVSDQDGSHYFAFQLYDANGSPVAQSDGLQQYPEGLTVRSGKGELLLSVPSDPGHPIQYRLYNSFGNLLTCSDGTRTLIYPMLRMGGDRRR